MIESSRVGAVVRRRHLVERHFAAKWRVSQFVLAAAVADAGKQDLGEHFCP